MRAYREAGEEALRARKLLKDWAGEGFLTQDQYRQMEQETVCEFRRTNIFLRVVLFLFTLVILGAGVALFFTIFMPRASSRSTGVAMLVFAAAAYWAAEAAVSQAKLYRHGIEEALAACSVGFFCAGLIGTFLGDIFSSQHAAGAESFVAITGAVASLWIWHRFGLWYAFPAAMIFLGSLPLIWKSSPTMQHVIWAGFCVAGVAAIAAVRSGARAGELDFQIAEAFLWAGLYLAINLQLSSVNGLNYWTGSARNADAFSQLFYWTTWVLTWCVPPLVLARGIRGKDRVVTGAGAAMAILTLITNKPYLGWKQHSWDPMLLGVLLIAVPVLLRRYLERGPDGARRGYTARRLSGDDKRWLNLGSTVLGATAPQPSAGEPGMRFGGGDSGGGGATSDF